MRGCYNIPKEDNPLHDTKEYKALKKARQKVDECQRMYDKVEAILNYFRYELDIAKDKLNKANDAYLMMEESFVNGN